MIHQVIIGIFHNKAYLLFVSCVSSCPPYSIHTCSDYTLVPFSIIPQYQVSEYHSRSSTTPGSAQSYINRQGYPEPCQLECGMSFLLIPTGEFQLPFRTSKKRISWVAYRSFWQT